MFLSVQNLHTKVETGKCDFWLLVYQANKINKYQSKGPIIYQGIDKSTIPHWWQKWYSHWNLIKVVFSVFFGDISDNLHDKSDISTKIFDISDIFPGDKSDILIGPW